MKNSNPSPNLSANLSPHPSSPQPHDQPLSLFFPEKTPQKSSSWGVAVSGGPDSLAALLLTQKWLDLYPQRLPRSSLNHDPGNLFYHFFLERAHFAKDSSSQELEKKVRTFLKTFSDHMCHLFQQRSLFPPHDGPIQVYALMVDHGLRTTSAEEVQQTKRWCDQWHIPHHTVRWLSTIPPSFKENPSIPWAEVSATKGNLMEKARIARYAALAWLAHRLHITHIVLGHHQDDNLETFLMRQEKNSGWRGLSGLSQVTWAFGLPFLRPLLSCSKEEIKAFLKSQGQPWLEDPSNSHPKFSRGIIRKRLSCCTPQEKSLWTAQLKHHSQNREYLTQKVARHLEKTLAGQKMPNFGSSTPTALYWRKKPGHIQISRLLFDNFSQEERLIALKGWMAFLTFSCYSFPHLQELSLQLVSPLPFKKYPQHLVFGGCSFYLTPKEIHIFRQYQRWGPLIALTEEESTSLKPYPPLSRKKERNCHEKDPPLSSLKKWGLVWDSRFFGYNLVQDQLKTFTPHQKTAGSFYHRLPSCGLPGTHTISSWLYKDPCPGLPCFYSPFHQKDTFCAP